MDLSPTRHEERQGAFKAVFWRMIIPSGLIGSIPLFLIAGMIAHSLFLAFFIYPFIVLLVAFCGIRSSILAHGWARAFAAIVGVVFTAVAAFLTFGLFIASGGI